MAGFFNPEPARAGFGLLISAANPSPAQQDPRWNQHPIL